MGIDLLGYDLTLDTVMLGIYLQYKSVITQVIIRWNGVRYVGTWLCS